MTAIRNTVTGIKVASKLRDLSLKEIERRVCIMTSEDRAIDMLSWLGAMKANYKVNGYLTSSQYIQVKNVHTRYVESWEDNQAVDNTLAPTT